MLRTSSAAYHSTTMRSRIDLGQQGAFHPAQMWIDAVESVSASSMGFFMRTSDKQFVFRRCGTRLFGVGLVLLVIGGGGGACAAVSFAPMARAPSYPTPGRLRPGQAEVQTRLMVATAEKFDALGPFVGGGVDFSLSPIPLVQVDLGVDYMHNLWLVGTAGLRVPMRFPENGPLALGIDAEIGFTGGVGGWRCENREVGDKCEGDLRWDGRNFLERPMGGLYGGLGIGGFFHWFSIYGRARIQGGFAKGTPDTAWMALATGMEFNILDRARLHIGTGWIHGWNSASAVTSIPVEVGVSFPFWLDEARRQAWEVGELAAPDPTAANGGGAP